MKKSKIEMKSCKDPKGYKASIIWKEESAEIPKDIEKMLSEVKRKGASNDKKHN